MDSALTVAAQHAIPHVRASPSCRQTTESERHDVAAKERQNGGAGGPSSQAATSNNAPASSSNEPSSPSLLGSAGPCFVQAAWADDADWYREELEALSDRLPPAHVKALAAGGAAGLFARLAEEAAAQLPEFLQPRPKYYHYFNWMRERITQALGAPPEEARRGSFPLRRLCLLPRWQEPLRAQLDATTWHVIIGAFSRR